MRTIFAICAAALAAVSLAACAAPAPASSQQEVPSSSQAASAPSQTGEQAVFGIIEDATMNTLTVKNEAGETLSFTTMDADKTNCDGLEIGTGVRVYYTGEIKGTDTSGATVVRLEQDGEDTL